MKINKLQKGTENKIKTKPKYAVQRDDAAERLGIEIEPVREEVAVFIDSISGEGLTLGAAIKKLAPEMTVFGDMIGERVTYVLEEGRLIQGGSAINPIYCVNQRNRFGTIFHGNYGNFKGVTGNKRLTSMILRNAGIGVPREIPLYMSDYLPKYDEDIGDCGALSREEEMQVTRNRVKNVKEFCISLGTDSQVVLKPIDGQCGKHIKILSYDGINEEIMHQDEFSIGGDILVQEKIDSYPVFDEQLNRKDWNVRVLTTTDKNGETIVAGITGRIDDDGGPVNRSISAENISLSDIGILAGLDESQVLKIKRKIEETAIKSVDAIKKKIKTKKPIERQYLAGVDIIIGKDLEPYVIEVNDSDSGCMYELMCLEGLDSILPIAESIVYKVVIGHHMMSLYDDFEEVFGEFTQSFIKHIFAGNIEIEEKKGKIIFVGINDEGIKFLQIIGTLKEVQLEEQEKSL